MISTRAQMEMFGYGEVMFEDILVDPSTGSIHIIASMMDDSKRHRFRLISTPVSEKPVTWLNSLSLEERGPDAEKFLAELQRKLKIRGGKR